MHIDVKIKLTCAAANWYIFTVKITNYARCKEENSVYFDYEVDNTDVRFFRNWLREVEDDECVDEVVNEALRELDNYFDSVDGIDLVKEMHGDY